MSRGLVSTPGDTRVSGIRSSLLTVCLWGSGMFGCSGVRPRDLGRRAGILRPCPDTPSCVSSETGTRESQRVAPLAAPGGPSELSRLAALVAAWPRTVVATTTGTYLHAEFTSLVWRFADDVEFRYDASASVIHVRSASRIGRGDLGANRKRVEGIRTEWERR